jgi:hypothetical protein
MSFEDTLLLGPGPCSSNIGHSMMVNIVTAREKTEVTD